MMVFYILSMMRLMLRHPQFGSGDVETVVGTVSTGSVSGVQIDDGGTNYEIDHVLTFTDNTNQSGLLNLHLVKFHSCSRFYYLRRLIG